MEKIEYQIMYNLEGTYWWYRGLHELVEKYLRRQQKKKSSPLLMLDAGCGTGRMMERARSFGRIDGFDFSDDAIHFCKQRGLATVVQQDINKWESAPECYDVIMTFDVLCHSSIQSEERIVRNFFKGLKPGAILILQLPAFEILRRRHDAAVHTRKRYTKRPTIDMLKREGFSIVHASYRYSFLFFVMLLKKAIEKAFPARAVESDLKPLPGWLNGVLLLLTRAENALLFRGASLPLGGSLFIIAKK